MGPRGESPPVVIGEVQALSAQLPPQNAVLLDEVCDHLSLAALQPASQHHQQHLEKCAVDHEPELIAWTKKAARLRASVLSWDNTGNPDVIQPDQPPVGGHTLR